MVGFGAFWQLGRSYITRSLSGEPLLANQLASQLAAALNLMEPSYRSLQLLNLDRPAHFRCIATQSAWPAT